jgi:lysophospholipase L1-like esterase
MCQMKTILCYGDSNTWGARPMESAAPVSRYAPDARWPGVLRQKLGAEYCVIEEGLGARTTVRDDPVDGAHRNGLRYLLPCLQSHQPLDLVILLLGTNDLKAYFGAAPADVATGIAQLVAVAQASATGPGGITPQVLVLAPPPLGPLSLFAGLYAGGEAASRLLATLYAEVARRAGCHFFDTATVVASSPIDGVHLEADAHHRLGQALVPIVRAILEGLSPGPHSP